MALEDQVSGKGEQRFIGHRQPDNSKHQQAEDCQVAVLSDPG